jgi:cytochrome c nitrite reductase small subunit
VSADRSAGSRSAIGLGTYAFVYAEGYAYLLDDPEACANCHVMRPQLGGWLRGRHRAVATCNDCHTPEGLLSKVATKAINGWSHSRAFTTGDFHEPIRAGERNQEIARASCTTCHAAVVHSMEPSRAAVGDPPTCVRA